MPKRKWSEFEVQAVAWTSLNKAYGKQYSVRGEYRLWIDPPDNEPDLRESVRLDIAILTKDESKILIILQVKRNKTGRVRGKIHRIHQHPHLVAIPLIIIEGMDQAIHITDILHNKYPQLFQHHV